MDDSPVIPTHDCALNLMLLASTPGRVPDLAQGIAPKILELRDRYTRPSTVRWLPEMTGGEARWAGMGAFYNPRTYACLGVFDIATLYLSPAISHPLPPADKFRGVGQHVHMCLLPRLDALPGFDYADFNLGFIKNLQRPALDAPLPAAERFLVFIKLKINPPVAWPAAGDAQPYTRFIRLLAKAGAKIQEWREACGSEPPVALCLGSGWSEIVVVASSYSIGWLLRLIGLLRSQWDVVFWPGEEHAHSFATSLSHIAFDHRLALDVRKHFRKGMSAEALLKTTEKVASRYPRHDGGKPVGIYISPSFSTYPGHEQRLAERGRRAAAAKGWARYPGAIMREQPAQLGKYDLAAPTLYTTERFDDTSAVIFAELFRAWVLREGDDPFRPPSDKPITFYDSDTRVGLPTLDSSFGVDVRFPPRHYVHRPSQLPTPGRKVLDQRLDAVVLEIIDRMRHLQVPYSRAEQVSNLIAKFTWTMQSDILWEDALPFCPLVLCLARYLEALHAWWHAASLRASSNPPRAGQELDPFQRGAQEIRERLDDFHRRQLPELLAAFRTNFHHRHLGGYLTDQTPDFNLRYRGSVQALLNLSNMILDAMVGAVLGKRACVATIGDALTPIVTKCCDVIITQLHADTITVPILLETLAHEVANLFLSEINGGDHLPLPGGALRNPWLRGSSEEASFQRVREAIEEIRDDVFFGEIEAEGYFIESAADFLEKELLDYEDAAEWLSSFTLRQLLASPPIHQDLPWERHESDKDPLVPAPDERVMDAAIYRAVFVTVAEELLGWGEDEPYEDLLVRLREGPLRDLRRTLLETCMLGPSRRLVDEIEDEDSWSARLDESFDLAPWLFDREAARAAARFYRALSDHARSANGAETGASARIWQLIRGEFRMLRQGILPLLQPSLYLRHWLSAEESAAGVDRDEIERQGRPDKFPWRAVPQPTAEFRRLLTAREEGSDDCPEFKVVVIQRGRIAPMSYQVGEQIWRANNRFISTLFSLLPAWRSSLLDRIAHLEES